jgi:hypothetical protein
VKGLEAFAEIVEAAQPAVALAFENRLIGRATGRIEAGQFAFFATVEDVAADGLEGALPIGDRRRLQDWRASNETAWFFIDSIDPRR